MESLYPTTPCTNSWSHYTPCPQECSNKEPCILGVDEAGRGPVLGCMVYAVAYVPLSQKDELGKIGFADSKVLKPEQRDDLFETILKEKDWIGWGVHACSPQDISESMLRRNKYNLNALAHDTTIGMIQHVLDQGVNLAEIYVDTVGAPDKYQEKLLSIFPNISITVAKKADSKYPVVSAASICAKVTRDFTMKQWKFVEPGVEVTTEFGSGYPADPNTVKWLDVNFDFVFGYPRIIRFSWSTADNLIEEKGAPFKWENEEDPQQPTLQALWSKAGKAPKKSRDEIYSRMQLKFASDW